jgi:hypothetical protein
VGGDYTHDAFSRVRKERDAADDLKSHVLECITIVATTMPTLAAASRSL